MIFFDENLRTFFLESKDVTYSFKINEAGFLQHLYFGKRIEREDLSFAPPINTEWRIHGTYIKENGKIFNLNAYPNECPTYGRSDYRESMLAFDFDGVRVGDLVYDSHYIINEKPTLSGMPSIKGGQTLVVLLVDTIHNVEVKLFYTVFEDLPVILRHCEIVNRGKTSFNIDRVYSFSLDFPDKNWKTLSLFGAHGRERMVETSDIVHGVTVFDSKRGVSSSQLNPFMAMVRNNTTEFCGEAVGFNLVYSGNFELKVQKAEADGVRVTGGINDFDFSWKLNPNETFVSPEAVLVYSDSGIGKMSRAFHDLYRNYLINPKFAFKPRPIVLNVWEALRFDISTQKILDMVDSIKDTGIDTLVVDDGWFGGEKGRNDEFSGLGDWVVNKNKINLKEIIDYTHNAGLKFGLWFEPEVASPNSNVVINHPNYILRADGLEPCEGRWSYVLDLTQKEVCDYVVNSVNAILEEYDVDYVKWDMNRSLTEFCSSFDKETAHRYVLGLYDILERIVYEHPEIFFEGCASGGCRFDPAMLYYFPQIWTSDNTDAYMRALIQYGTGLCYPLSAMSCHVSAVPNKQCGRVTPFNSRFNVSRLGAFGFELKIAELSNQERLSVKEFVDEYIKTQDLILNGDLYRLNSPFNENLFAEQIVSKNAKNSIIVVFKPISVHNEDTVRVYPQGLMSDKKYFIKELGIERSGGVIMAIGLPVNLKKQDFESFVYHLETI